MLQQKVVGTSRVETNFAGAAISGELGTSVAAPASTHTKNTTYTTLIASTAFDAYGVYIEVANVATAATRTGILVDIAIGAASSETVIIANLMAGAAPNSATSTLNANGYYFPIKIPAGTRVSATCQAAQASDTVFVALHLFQHPIQGMWYGSRVTTYGADTATSSGTSMSPGNGSYATDVQLIASTTNPIKYMQMGWDLLTDTVASNARGLVRISVGSNPVATDLIIGEGSTLEVVGFLHANIVLSHMRFNIPSGVQLNISAQRNVAAAARGWIVYGVD